ncbi:extracellular solute-binding protein family 1 [Paenibacillus algicola]|uniref:Extracellular solute-binding protein family 1 n=1 Tax=Paenibacillus algicola TaxID=2565926 RepID=A0A4P8XGY2_9BACL|nr:extracellular solute-binding protein [Paenibacillus algicola]QCT01538.1 extracellular solute-binding protein family 1 [Paenibacillus algicola]
MKKIYVMISWIALIVLAIGCSGEKSDSANPNDANQQAGAKNTEKIKISLLAPSYSGGGWPDNNHPIIKFINDKFNIDLDVQWIPGPNYDEKLNVLAASGNLPDIYTILPSSDLYEKWQGEGAFAELQDRLDSYPNLKQAFPDPMWQMKNPNGIIYGLPKGGPVNPYAYIVRKDWMENLGLSIPDPENFTVEQFYEIAKAFALNDPDQNGKKDTIGISFNSGFGGEAPLRYAFGLSPGWQEIDGQLVPWQVQSSELKNYLTFLNTAYEEGVLDKDFPLNTGKDIQDKLSSGKLGLFDHIPINMIDNEMKLKQSTPEAEFIQIPPPKGASGIQYNQSQTLAHKIVLNGKLDDAKLQRILELFDWWVTEEGTDIIRNGPPGVYYTEKEDGTYEPTEAAINEGNRISILNNWFFRTIANDHDVYKWDSKEKRDRVTTFMEQAAVYASPIDPVPGIANQSPAYAKQFSAINNEFLQSVYKIIIGEQSLDSIDAAIAKWRANGGDQIIKEINEAYQSVK